MRLICLALLCFLALPAVASPLFPNSVASNDLDFITADDPSAFVCLTGPTRGTREMPNQPSGGLFADNVFIYIAHFADSADIPVWVHPDVTDPDTVAMQVTGPLGRLPGFLRGGLRHVVINPGDAGASAESDGGFFMLSQQNMAERIANHDLEETVFHESVHAVMDNMILRDPDWAANQTSDRGFITDYAAARPAKEDLAETALFAYTMWTTPGRLPADVAAAVRAKTPNRLEYLTNIFAGMTNPPMTRTGCPGA